MDAVRRAGTYSASRAFRIAFALWSFRQARLDIDVLSILVRHPDIVAQSASFPCLLHPILIFPDVPARERIDLNNTSSTSSASSPYDSRSGPSLSTPTPSATPMPMPMPIPIRMPLTFLKSRTVSPAAPTAHLLSRFPSHSKSSCARIVVAQGQMDGWMVNYCTARGFGPGAGAEMFLDWRPCV